MIVYAAKVSSIIIFGVLSLACAQDMEGAIYCDYYNEKSCGGKFREDCVEKLYCASHEPSKRRLCFVAWNYDEISKKPIIQSKGCLRGPLKECYDKPHCIDEYSKTKKQNFFCCCDSNMCNRNFSVYQPTISQPILPFTSILTTAPTLMSTTTLTLPPPMVQVSEHKSVIITEQLSSVSLLIISIALFFSIIFTSTVLYYCRHKKLEYFNTISKIEQGLVPRPPPNLGNTPVCFIDVKAHGRFGSVWKAKLSTELVAVKIFPHQNKSSWLAEFEIFKLPHMDHENILRFIGAQEHKSGMTIEYWLVVAYHEKGSLFDYLKANVLSWPELCRIAESMTRGLGHLHTEIQASNTIKYKPPVAHRDFKSKNILLKKDMTACIADFGLSLIFHPDKPNDHFLQVGTSRYMAPELLEGAINFSRDSFLRTDIYSCGLVLWELVTRCTAQKCEIGEYKLPYEREIGLEVSLQKMRECVVSKKQRPVILDTWREHLGLQSICDTMEECWDDEPEARLSALCVMERMARLRLNPLIV